MRVEVSLVYSRGSDHMVAACRGAREGGAMRTSRYLTRVVQALLFFLCPFEPTAASEEHADAIRLLERIDSASRFDADWASSEALYIRWSPDALTPVNMYRQVQIWIHADANPDPAEDRTGERLRSAREIWDRRKGTEREKAIVLLAGLRTFGVRARPLVVRGADLGGVASSGGGIPRDAVLIEVDLPSTDLGARYGGRQTLDPGCLYCGFGELRPVFYGREGFALDGGNLSRRELPVPEASANRLEHRVTVEMESPRRVGRSILPGGFSSPDTADAIPSMDYSVEQEIIVTGALRGVPIPATQPVPLQMGFVRLGPVVADPPDIMRGEGRSGQMCGSRGPDGAYRIASAVVDPLYLFADSAGTGSMRLPFPFEIVTVLTVPLRPSWRLIDLPEPVSFERPGISFQLGIETAPDRYVRSLHLRVEKTEFTDGAARDFHDLVRSMRGCSGRMGRIRP